MTPHHRFDYGSQHNYTLTFHFDGAFSADVTAYTGVASLVLQRNVGDDELVGLLVDAPRDVVAWLYLLTILQPLDGHVRLGELALKSDSVFLRDSDIFEWLAELGWLFYKKRILHE